MNKKNNLLTVLVVTLVAIGVIIFFFSLDEGGLIGTFVSYGLILTVVSVVLAMFFALQNVIKDKESMKKTLTTMGLFLVILVISYLVSSSSAVYDATGKMFEGSEGSVSKWIGASINYSIILLLISGGLFVVDMVKNAFK